MREKMIVSMATDTNKGDGFALRSINRCTKMEEGNDQLEGSLHQLQPVTAVSTREV
jgi:hypothetical protein